MSVTEKKGFQRFEFFDEFEGANTFEQFNKVLTVAASFGLTIGQVLMLPFNIISDMEAQATDKDNAYFVANFLLSPEHQSANQAWISKMTPETQAKLLTVLINYNPIPTFSVFGDTETERRIAAIRNQNQRRAIIQVLQWLGGPTATARQMATFENTVQRMNLQNPMELNKSEQWRKYADNLFMLRDFFLQAFTDKYEPPIKSEQTYMRDLYRDYKKFREHMIFLTGNTQVMQKSFLGKGTRAKVQETYIAVSNSDVIDLQQEGFRLATWLPEN
ncbi:hypothetical protein [Vibrio sp. SCSIO 43135]|uniref:hypothetical protein n=1 Tax=Vibrio sp. SCSIO 43135 TaxID=2819096 RepID=UPI0020753358|nr:hypothetical protein [Vibrio sp. SCSIO 43135]